MSIAPEYIAARSVLLDALVALGPHRRSVVLVGAQAVYHHTGVGALSVAPMTTDGDLAIDTSDLAEDPEISEAMMRAGFALGDNPGHWMGRGDVMVDLMVAFAQSGATRSEARAARIAPHEKQTARIARGLEPALIDNAPAVISAFDDADQRHFEIRIAGPAALVVAKLIKISERMAQEERQPTRVKEKDALDVFRVLQAIPTEELVDGFRKHSEDNDAAAISAESLIFLRKEGTDPSSALPRLAASATLDDPTVAPSFAILAYELLAALDS